MKPGKSNPTLPRVKPILYAIASWFTRSVGSMGLGTACADSAAKHIASGCAEANTSSTWVTVHGMPRSISIHGLSTTCRTKRSFRNDVRMEQIQQRTAVCRVDFEVSFVRTGCCPPGTLQTTAVEPTCSHPSGSYSAIQMLNAQGIPTLHGTSAEVVLVTCACVRLKPIASRWSAQSQIKT